MLWRKAMISEYNSKRFPVSQRERAEGQKQWTDGVGTQVWLWRDLSKRVNKQGFWELWGWFGERWWRLSCKCQCSQSEIFRRVLLENGRGRWEVLMVIGMNPILGFPLFPHWMSDRQVFPVINEMSLQVWMHGCTQCESFTHKANIPESTLAMSYFKRGTHSILGTSSPFPFMFAFCCCFGLFLVFFSSLYMA